MVNLFTSGREQALSQLPLPHDLTEEILRIKCMWDKDLSIWTAWSRGNRKSTVGWCDSKRASPNNPKLSLDKEENLSSPSLDGKAFQMRRRKWIRTRVDKRTTDMWVSGKDNPYGGGLERLKVKPLPWRCQLLAMNLSLSCSKCLRLTEKSSLSSAMTYCF